MTDSDTLSQAVATFLETLRDYNPDDDNGKKKKKVNWKATDVGLKTHNKKYIVIPEDMTIDDLEGVVHDIKADFNQEVDIAETIEATHPFEAAVALVEAMHETWGKAMPRSTFHQSFFGPMEEKPDMVTVQTGVGEWVQVPLGAFKIPGVKAMINVGPTRTRQGRLALAVSATVRKREQGVIRDLVNLTRAILKERSIYKGKAFKIETDSNHRMDFNNPPLFFATDNARPDDIILNESAQIQLDVIRGMITHQGGMRGVGVPRKRTVLFVGPHGTGKTESLIITCDIALQYGWTVISIANPASLKEALYLAKKYGPSLITVEDLDRIPQGDATRDLMNVIDGEDMKGADIMVIATSNHVETLPEGMLRMGRVDNIVPFLEPDEETVKKLIHKYGRGKLIENIDLSTVAARLSGNTASTVEGAVQNAKMAMVVFDRKVITESDLLYAIATMEGHMALLRKKAPEPPLEQQVGELLGQLVTTRNPVDSKTVAKVDETYDLTKKIAKRIL